MAGLAILIEEETKARGWSYRRLAEEAGVSPMAISKLVNNPDQLPNLDTLAGLSKALRLPLRRLIEACGFPVDQPSNDNWQQRAQAIIAAVPELQHFLDPIVELAPDDRQAVLAYIEGRAQRRKTG